MSIIPILQPDFEQSPTGLWAPKRARRRRPTCIDLFAGAGGFSLGMIQAGFDVVAAADNDPACFYTYTINLGAWPLQVHYAEPEDKERLNSWLERETKRANKAKGGIYEMPSSGSNRHRVAPDFDGVRHYFFGDIKKFTGQQILDAIGMERGEVDCMVGGPPCQGFSKAGKQNVMDPRNSLLFEFARLIVEILPKTMVMENVPGILDMVTPEGLPVVEAFGRILEDGGFGGVDAIKRSLLHTSGAGAGAALRGKKLHDARTEKLELDQVQMFG